MKTYFKCLFIQHRKYMDFSILPILKNNIKTYLAEGHDPKTDEYSKPLKNIVNFSR